MNLSTLTGDAKPYLEYGWVCAFNTAQQSIPNNTITALTLTNEIADTGNYGSISSNQITLAAGTYYYDIQVPCSSSSEERFVVAVSLYNVTDSAYVSRAQAPTALYAFGQSPVFKGQFTISATKVFQLQINSSSRTGTVIVGAYSPYATLTGTGATDDQRTTIKLWKLA